MLDLFEAQGHRRMKYPKRLIEVDLPIKRISAHARREKSIRHGHISTLHIWWARRPLAACRAVICAALWPDPADPNCPPAFRDKVRVEMLQWTPHERQVMLSAESRDRFEKARQKPALFQDSVQLRGALLDFIAAFANWDNSTKKEYVETSRALTQAAHEALGGEPGTKPLVVDPFAGGGSIPLEALRVGADAFASDLNPVAVLLNKVILEYIPKYGRRLADEARKWGKWIKEQAEKELAEFYPKDPEGAIPIAYLWARTIQCEGPGCGGDVPLVGRPIIAKRKIDDVAIALKATKRGDKLSIEIVQGKDACLAKSTCKGFVATCPRDDCGYSTPKKNVQKQLTGQGGGSDSATLLAVLTEGHKVRRYREPNHRDREAFDGAARELEKRIKAKSVDGLPIIPHEPIPQKTAHRAVGSQLPLYGFKKWGDLFNCRQKLAIITLQEILRQAYSKLEKHGDLLFAHAVFTILSFAIDKQVDYSSTLCRWVSRGEFIAGTLAGEKKYPMISDFAEANPIGPGSGSWDNQIDWIARFIEKEARVLEYSGVAIQCSADDRALPIDAASAMVTDPPYYDSVPYSDLSDYFYVWLKRTVHAIEQFSQDELTPKAAEMTVNHPNNQEEKDRYEKLLTSAFRNGRDVTNEKGIGVIVFAHKSTSGWETLLEAIVKSGWIITASWPIDTERSVRPNALETASLASSVHITCRPREDPDIMDEIGDWRDILSELPKRIHEWMPRLSEEAIVGADAIFACLGPALEIFSRYSRVEKASGEAVTLKEYLEEVWAAVAKEALTMIFTGADATGFEEDARLTAMWLWTLSGVKNGNGKTKSDENEEESVEEEESGKSKKTLNGYILEYDAARKIAQGLGAHLEKLKTIVGIKGEIACLLPVSERTRYLFGKEESQAPSAKRKKKEPQLKLGFMQEMETMDDEGGWGEKSSPKVGSTTLDRLHQSMILFAAGRSEAMKRFLVEEGIGNDQRFWRLAQALSALYPKTSDEKRWVDGVLGRKKGLGF